MISKQAYLIIIINRYFTLVLLALLFVQATIETPEEAIHHIEIPEYIFPLSQGISNTFGSRMIGYSSPSYGISGMSGISSSSMSGFSGTSNSGISGISSIITNGISGNSNTNTKSVPIAPWAYAHGYRHFAPTELLFVLYKKLRFPSVCFEQGCIAC